MAKILILNYEFPPLGGGAGNATYYLLKEYIKQKNLKIDLITSSVNKYKKEQFASNIKIHYLNIGKKNQNVHYQTNKNLLVYSWRAYWFVKKLIRKKQYDLIHAFFGIPCGFIAMLLGKPYIVSLRGSDVPFYNPRFYKADKYFFQYLDRFIWKRAKAIIANSQSLKELALQTNSRQKIEIIPNGVDATFFKPNPKIKKENIILFVGRLIKRKGINYLIKAFANIDKKYKKNYQLWLVGDGPKKQSLINLVKKLNILTKVKFLGIKSKKELANIYNKTKIFVLPSLNEGMSNTVLEAMACGLPIIITDTGGTRELLRGNGVIIKTRDPNSIVQAIRKFIDNKDLIAKMGKKSRKIAESFNWKNVAEEYLKIYKEFNEN